MIYIRYYLQEKGLIKLKNGYNDINDDLIYYKILEHGYKTKRNKNYKKIILYKN